MILVILGTQDKEFKRLLVEVEKCIDNKTIKEEVIVQAGFTKFETDKMKIFDLISTDEFKKYILESSLIITHGGVGSIMDSIKSNKKVIALPRLKEYKEHTNDHQLQIISEFKRLGYILGGTDVSDLEKLIKKSKTFKPKKFKSNINNFVKLIEDYIK